MTLDMILLDEPDKVPADRSAIGDDVLISGQVWAALQGVSHETVMSNRSRHNRRRNSPEARPGDMPLEDEKIGRAPYWKMSTYRAWEASRPGKGEGAGRPKGAKDSRPRRAPSALKLPAQCPHCHREIRGEDVLAVSSGQSGE